MRAPTYWTLDLGNSACKLRERNAVDVSEGTLTTFANDGGLVEKLGRRLQQIELLGAAFSSVADEALTSELVELLESASPVLVTTADALLTNESTTPGTVGKDRLFAALGALIELPREQPCAIVCDAGTALTVDLVLRSPSPELLGRFLGGAIAPGPELLAQALASGGARLFEVKELGAPGSAWPALGRDTEGALAAGIVHGFRGAARELATRIAEEGGVPDAPICLTGGASGLLAGVFEAARVLQVPGLVDRGLLAALERELRG